MPARIADCINNASIALHLIGEIEEIEKDAAARSGTEFEDYLLHDRIHAVLAREASLILKYPSRATRERWIENDVRLRLLQRRYPTLKILGQP